MARVRLIAKNSRFGPADYQREVTGDCAIEITDLGEVQDRVVIRDKDTLCVAHARILGKYHARERIMTILADRDITVSVAGSDPYDVAMAEARAEIHELAKMSTGKGTRKQQRNAGRPSRYPEPDPEQLARMQTWYAGVLHLDDVAELIGEMLRCDPPDRGWIIRKLKKRPPNPDRARKPRSDKGVRKSD